jgi:hypothetical protein
MGGSNKVAAKSANADRAKTAEAAFRVRPGIYLVGSLERGVTVYNQQLRAHNLAWALWELEQKRTRRRIGRVAIVGGGITGLTMAACILSLFEDVSVFVFEQLWDLCPLQQGSDGRWLHPKIYDWPAEGSRAPSASLPVLNWSEGRASDVVRTIVQSFSRYCASFADTPDRLSVVLGLRHFQIDAKTREIYWVGSKAIRAGAFFHSGGSEGGSMVFDSIVLAAGFGLETLEPGYSTPSYWRNEQLGQPVLNTPQRRYIVSGFGDGALIDLSRLTIERFRQDTIVYELFKENIEAVEAYFSDRISSVSRDANMFELFRSVELELLGPAKAELSNRIRKDTHVTLHLRGRNGEIKAFSEIFGRHSSLLNRLITYLLYRCGAFAPDFSDLSTAVTRHNVPPENVLCRYGANTIEHLNALFVDSAVIKKRLAVMKEKEAQTARQLWPPGVFRRP